MKKLITILVLALGVSSCTKVEKVSQYSTPPVKVNRIEFRGLGNTDYNNIKIVEIDGCEYLFGDWANTTVLTHKGNCKRHIPNYK